LDKPITMKHIKKRFLREVHKSDFKFDVEGGKLVDDNQLSDENMKIILETLPLLRLQMTKLFQGLFTV